MSSEEVAHAAESFKSAYEQEQIRRQRAERTNRRWKLFATIVLLPVLVMATIGVLKADRALRDIRQTTVTIERVTSPAAQAAGDKQLEDLVKRLTTSVDCNTRGALQDLVNVLVERKVLVSGSLTVQPCTP